MTFNIFNLSVGVIFIASGIVLILIILISTKISKDSNSKTLIPFSILSILVGLLYFYYPIMYKNLILKFMTFDLILGVFWIAFGVWLIWMGIKNLNKATNPKLFFSVSAMFILLGLLYFYSIRMNFFDYSNYLKMGDNYLETKTCKVIDDMSYTVPSIMFGNEDIKCNDGKWYHICYQRTYQKVRKKGKIFKIIFLPKSRIIIKTEKLN